MKSVTTLFVLSSVLVAAPAILPGPAGAATVPFTEDFTSDVANWANSSSTALVDYVASGGPAGDSYASTTLVPAGSGDSSVVLFRGQDEFSSSGGAFEGNWIAEGVGEFSAYVRHNAPMPLTFFTRFASPANYPGAVAVKFVPVLPSTWTQISFDISATNPELVSYEGTDFAAVFSNVGHVQIGVDVPLALDEVTVSLTLDLDRPTILAVPEPAGAVLAVVGLACCIAWRRVA